MADEAGAPWFADHIVMLQLAPVRLEDRASLEVDKVTFMASAQKLNQVSIPSNRTVIFPGQLISLNIFSDQKNSGSGSFHNPRNKNEMHHICF